MPNKEKKKIRVLKDGPYEVIGDIPMDHLKYIPNPKGYSLDYEEIEKYPLQESYYLCRCGKSKTRPYCDGSHNQGFDGTETAKLTSYDEMAKCIEGIQIDLMDAEELCVGARFCDTKSGTWNLVERAENPEAKDIILHQTKSCPSGRLTAVTKDGERIEPVFEQEISILEDPAAKVMGPIWVKGHIEIKNVDGVKYPPRNRVTLCRCGKSKNKPFCDASHFKKE